MSRKLLQISCDSNWGSIGRIIEQIGTLSQIQGWDANVIYGRDSNASALKTYKAGNLWNVYEHYAEHRLFDNDGLASRKTTKLILKEIDRIRSDVIHLHNIHDHWLNYELLFDYLIKINKPVVWTQHDCWSFTGGCGYYSMRGCNQWQSKCVQCPIKHNKIIPLIDKTAIHYEKKKHLFNQLSNLTLVPVSKWLENEIKKSFLSNKSICQIYNGVDVTTFKPLENDNIRTKLGVGEKNILLGVATTWAPRKGLSDYIHLSQILPSNMVIVLVGLTKQQCKKMPSSIIGLERTQNVNELVELYSVANIVLNLSYEETFGLTTVEGFACGTPSIVYNCTASPELITDNTGVVVSPGDIQGVANAICKIEELGKSYYSNSCRERAVTMFNKDDRFADYINLYEDLLK